VTTTLGYQYQIDYSVNYFPSVNKFWIVAPDRIYHNFVASANTILSQQHLKQDLLVMSSLSCNFSETYVWIRNVKSK